MFKVITVDQFGRDRVSSEWLSGSLAVDAARALDRLVGHTLRDIIIVDGLGDVVFTKVDLGLARIIRSY